MSSLFKKQTFQNGKIFELCVKTPINPMRTSELPADWSKEMF